jgi:hypothetical protein
MEYADKGESVRWETVKEDVFHGEEHKNQKIR